jgi:CDGSH iron-sulfur domain-containing protein 3
MDTAPKKMMGPVQARLVAGETYAWCRCGLSKSAPFCDGTHEGTGCEPVLFVAKKSEVANVCGCGETDDPPYCDGTHNIL